ncbi:MAG: family 10 glycosylhydrolase [Myxococcota bacterium]|nr:family 10 glycosylhydrolase [Myxococcota bacterium]
MLTALLLLNSVAFSSPSVDESSAQAELVELEELRGIWVTRWTWKTEEELRGILRDVDNAGFNAVFLQVRGEFDAFYPSEIEPWGRHLTGIPGKDPGWDPLAVAVDQAHDLGLQLHAYLNVFPLWKAGEDLPGEGSPTHAIRAHPEWEILGPQGERLLTPEQPYHFASPGNPEVRFRIAQVAADIDYRYDVDGIHLDYIRYPHKNASRDPVSMSRFDASKPWADWQRDQVHATVAGVSAMVSVPVTAAVWGVNENRWGWSGVSQGKHDYYQDSHAMLERGLLDAIAPMVYWPNQSRRGERLDFSTLVADHVSNRGQRHVYVGVNAELTYEQLVECIRSARQQGAQGVIVFDYSLVRDNLNRLKSDVFQLPAQPPAMEWR